MGEPGSSPILTFGSRRDVYSASLACLRRASGAFEHYPSLVFCSKPGGVILLSDGIRTLQLSCKSDRKEMM
jgi:hypothetical protein